MSFISGNLINYLKIYEEMKGRKFSYLILLLILTAGICASRGTDTSRTEQPVTKKGEPRVIPSGCTVFTIARDGKVFFGGNDDYINPDSYYWVDPGDSSKYGVIWIGEPDNVQQGVNEKGLAYDANGLPRVDVNPHNERIQVSEDYNVYPIRLMHECATVDEVIKWVNSHKWHSYMHDQERSFLPENLPEKDSWSLPISMLPILRTVLDILTPGIQQPAICWSNC
jgi:hypothetical protein